MAKQRKYQKMVDDHLSQFAKEGIENPRAIAARRQERYLDILIEGVSSAGCEDMRGWWRDGEAIEDINWHGEERDGWRSDKDLEKLAKEKGIVILK